MMFKASLFYIKLMLHLYFLVAWKFALGVYV